MVRSFLVLFYCPALLLRNSISKLCLPVASPSQADMKCYFLAFRRGLSIVCNPRQTRPFTSRRASRVPGLRRSFSRPCFSTTCLPIRFLAFSQPCLLYYFMFFFSSFSSVALLLFRITSARHSLMSIIFCAQSSNPLRFTLAFRFHP